jgi:gliding motility-associated lipoprotein GldH
MRNYFLLLLVLTIVSCSNNEIFNQYKSIDNHQWTSENSIEFLVKSLDTISQKNVFINIRNNKDYEYSSIFLIAEIEFPNGYQVVDTLEYEMTDPSGKWLGSGYTDIKENKLFFKENVAFPEKGDYKFTINHATRGIKDIEGKEPLKGITDVGLSIEKVLE